MKELEKVTILKQDHFGDGLGKIDNELIFVKQGLEGEVVDVVITSEKNNFKRGKIEHILEASPLRQEAPCPYYGVCGGCQLQHENEEGQMHFKEAKIKEILSRYASYDGPIAPLKKGQSFHYRNKVVLKVKDHFLALSKEKTNELIPIKKCLLLPNKMNNLIEKIQVYLNESSPFQEIQIRINQKEEFLLAIQGNLELEKFLSVLKDFEVLQIEQNHKIIYQKSPFTMELLGFTFVLSSSSFFQVNREMTPILYQCVLDIVGEKKPKTLLDLYCGTGTLGLLASPYVDQVTGVEVVESAIQNAHQNKELNHRSNITFYKGKVEEVITSLPSFDFVIVDPPRKGLDAKTKKVLKQMRPKDICYVSCDPITLARDLNELQEFYKIDKVIPIDMFPNTYHVECVCALKLR